MPECSRIYNIKQPIIIDVKNIKSVDEVCK